MMDAFSFFCGMVSGIAITIYLVAFFQNRKAQEK
jgi:hypothetical protein